MIEHINEIGERWLVFVGPRLIDGCVLFVLVSGVWLLSQRWLNPRFGMVLFGLVVLKSSLPLPVAGPGLLSYLSPGQFLLQTAAEPVPRETLQQPMNEQARLASLKVQDLPPATNPPKPVDQMEKPIILPEKASAAPLSLPGALFLSWALIVTSLLSLFIRCQWRLGKAIRRSSSIDPATFGVDWPSLCHKFAMGASLPIRQLDLIDSPACSGLFRPLILVPGHLLGQLTPDQWTWVLAHELEHLRRRDVLWLAVERLVRTVYFFHPAIWLATAHMDRLREEACDRAALSVTKNARCAGESLLLIAERQLRSRLSFSLLPTILGGTKIKVRIEKLLSNDQPPMGKTQWLLKAAVLLGAIFAVPTVLATAPIEKPGISPPKEVAERNRARPKGVRDIRGTVIDMDGRPVKGAIVGARLKGTVHQTEPNQVATMTIEYVRKGAITNDRGEFTLKQQDPVPVIYAATDTGDQVGWAALNDDMLTIQLAPTCEIQMQLESPENPAAASGTVVFNDREFRFGSSYIVTTDFTTPSQLKVRLPAGRTFDVWIRGESTLTRADVTEVPKGERKLDLGIVELRASFEALYAGKAPPSWHITDSINLERTATLKDFHGKWVLLALIAPHEDDLYHDTIFGTSQILRDLEQFQFSANLLQAIVISKGEIVFDRDLPFPLAVLTDPTGKTLESYRVDKQSLQVLINPEGKVEAVRTYGMLATLAKLAGLPEPSASANLMSRAITFDFESTPFEDVILFIKDYLGVHVDVDWKSMKKADVGPRTEITLDLKSVTLGTALELILASIGLVYEIKDNTIVIHRRDSDDSFPSTEAAQIEQGMVREVLRRKSLTVDFAQTPIRDVVHHLKDATFLNFVLDYPSLKKAGKNEQTPVSLKLENVPILTALDDICGQAGLKWRMVGSVVVIFAADPKN